MSQVHEGADSSQVHNSDRAAQSGDVAVAFCTTLLDEWTRLGVQHVVLSPGSRSTPLALAAASSQLNLHVVLDERSAGFMAVGIAHASHCPAVLVCTSGTAAAEYHAAVVEAHQAALPVLVVTADRPPELQGVGAPQTIDQREIFGSAVRWYCEPGPPEPQSGVGWRHLARDAYVRSVAGVPGPVHLNLAFREPLVGVAAIDAPLLADDVQPPISFAGLTDEQLVRLASAVSTRRGLFVCGARSSVEPNDTDRIMRLAEQLGWPVLADHLSGCRTDHPNVIWTFDPLIRSGAMPVPEVVFTWGALLSSKVLGQFLAQSGAFHVGIDRYGEIPNPDKTLAMRINGSPPRFADALFPLVESVDPSWLNAWKKADSAARVAIASSLKSQSVDTSETLNASRAGNSNSEPAVDVRIENGVLSEPQVLELVVTNVPGQSAIVVSSSMPVRDLEWFCSGRNGMRVYSNRGANGIDGVTSTAIGAALAGPVVTLVIGDLAFLHDVSALVWLRDRSIDLQIVVIDNDGGGIFSFLPQRSVLSDPDFEMLYGTPHGLRLGAIVNAFGMSAVEVGTDEDLRHELISREHNVLIVRSERAANVRQHQLIFDAVADAVLGSLANPEVPS